MRTITIIIIIIILLVLPVSLPSHAGCGFGEEEEALYGTWINEEYGRSTGIGKVVFNPDGNNPDDMGDDYRIYYSL